MLLEECPRSTSKVSVKQPHFPVFQEFVGASYAERYQLLMTKLVRERLYDSSCFLMSSHNAGQKGKYLIPNNDLSFSQFAISLSGRVTSYVNAKRGGR